MSPPSSETTSWGACPLPREDELLSSWLARVASAHGLGTHRFGLNCLGVAGARARDIDRRVTAAIVARVAAGSGIDPHSVDAMTLAPFEAHLGPASYSAGVSPWILARGRARRSGFRFGQQACAHCLREGTGYLRQWRLAFHVICERHAAWLMDACPACDAPFEPERATGIPPRCISCSRYPTAGSVGAGPFFSQAGQLQRWLDQALQRRAPLMIGSREVPLAEALRGFRFLLRLDRRLAGTPSRMPCIERTRLTQRVHYLERLSDVLSRWPGEVVHAAERAGVSSDPFPGEHCPEWVLGPLMHLRAPRSRRKAPAVQEDPVLVKLRRRRPPNWRSRHAHRLVRLALPSK